MDPSDVAPYLVSFASACGIGLLVGLAYKVLDWLR